MNQKLEGLRTWISGLVAILALVVGIKLVKEDDRSDAFLAFAGGIVGIMGTVATKSAVGSLAQGGGLKGAMAALTTSAKPGEPPVTP
jgi:hypothetical protein